MEWTQAVVRYSLIGIVTISLTVFYIFLLVRLYRALKVKGDCDQTIRLSNQGNVPSVFQLTAEAPEDNLRFNFTSNGLPLIEVPVPVFPLSPTVPHSTFHIAGSQTGTPPPAPASNQLALDPSKAVGAGRAVAAKAGAVASFLGAIGNLLPGSLGNKIRAQGAAARGAQTSTINAAQAPDRAQRKVDTLKQESGRLSGSKSGGRGATAVNPAPSTSVEGQAGASQLQVATAQSIQESVNYRAQTREVKPGETISVNLQIGSEGKHYPQGRFLYTIHSHQLPFDQVVAEIPPVSARGTVHFKLIPTWRYWLPSIITGLVVLITGLSLLYFLTYFL